MSRCPFSISPSMEPPMLLAAELLLQPRKVDDIPMLGEFAVLDAPDVDRAEREAPAGRGNPLQRLGVRGDEAHSRDHLVAGDDAVLYPCLHVGHAAENAAEILDLVGEAAWAAA